MTSHLPLDAKKPEGSQLKRACIFGGTSVGRGDDYKNATIELGRELASKQLDLFYGGESTGLLGLVAQTIHDAGGHVFGFTLEVLRSEKMIGELRIVTSLHQRKLEIARCADCFIALPGGYEAMDGLLEAVSWAQLGIHDKPIGLLNVNGYFDDFTAFINKAIEDGFIRLSQKELIVQDNSVKGLLQKLEEYESVREGAIPKELWETEE